MEKLTNGIKGLDSIWRQPDIPDIFEGPRIPKTGDVLGIAILGVVGWALMKVLTGDQNC